MYIIYILYQYIILCTLEWTDKLQNDFGEHYYNLQSVT